MTRLLLKLPWFVSTPALLALTAALAFGANLVLSDYFERTFLDEADPLAAAGVPASSPTATPAAATSTSAAGAPRAVNTPSPVAEPTAPSPATPPPPTPAPAASPSGVLAEGRFRDGAPGHNGSGIARLLRTEDGSLFLRFERFSVTNGPDLFVYLTTGGDSEVEAGLNLGSNKATDGNINYEIPAGTDLSLFDSVVIWCRAANITFAIATLEAS